MFHVSLELMVTSLTVTSELTYLCISAVQAAADRIYIIKNVSTHTQTHQLDKLQLIHLINNPCYHDLYTIITHPLFGKGWGFYKYVP